MSGLAGFRESKCWQTTNKHHKMTFLPTSRLHDFKTSIRRLHACSQTFARRI